MNLSIKRVPEEQVARLRARAKANHRSLQGELRAIIDEATGTMSPKLTVEEIAARVSKLALQRRDEAVRLIDSASNLFHRAMLMTAYSTGMR